MRLIFSRKGFDSAAGGGPSPIVAGRPLSLPIPLGRDERGGTPYAALGLGDHVRDPHALCHHDPFFARGRVAFGQHGAAESHLRAQGVGPGDLFLFFGLFAGAGQPPHHRLFGWLRVEQRLHVGIDAPPRFARNHPHFANPHWRLNSVYVGPGGTARRASDSLRLTAPGCSPSIWAVPDWLWRTRGLSYHGRADRWLPDGRLRSVGRGQEFVVDVTTQPAAQDWASAMVEEMQR